MLEDPLLRVGVTDALDHRIVIPGIRINNALHHRTERRQSRIVCDVPGREDQRRFLAVQVGQFFLKHDVIVVRARNIARPASPGAAMVERLPHGLQHVLVLPHAEVIVGAPDGDVVLLTAFAMTRRRPAAPPLQVGKGPIPAFVVQIG